MKLLARLSLTLVLLASAAAPAAVAQTRPRRVGQTPTAAPTTAPAPAPERRAPTLESGRPAQTSQTTPAAQTSGEVSEEVGEDEVVRVNAALVTVPVSVLDRDGRFIGGLQQDDFRVLEDGVEQRIAYFAPVEQPFTVALVIDTSGSTRFRLEDIQDAAIAFLDQLRPADRVIVVSFDEQVRVLSEATNDRNQLRAAIRRTHTGGGTRLYDAVDLVINEQLGRVQGRKAVVLFTDGVDSSSHRASFESTLDEAVELDAMIYPIQYDTYDGSGGGGGGNWPGPNRYPGRRGGGRRNPGWGDILGGIILGGGNVRIGGGGGGGGGGGAGTTRADYERGGEYLRRLADATGGRSYDAQDIGYIKQAFTNIAEELRRQYSLGYYPSRQAQAEERRSIRVRVRRPNLVVRARDSYVYRPDGTTGPDATTAQGNTNTRQSAPVLRRNFDPFGGRVNDER
ncbi:MAG: VWA domain-containing protein [Acidobacteria bacterium]|nr:VWA domain-containing protein [Acidobacteriota bacterium]